MRSNVSLEQPRAREAFAARGTLAALVVGAHVLAEGGGTDVYFVAVRTLSGGLLVVRRAMRLPEDVEKCNYVSHCVVIVA